MLENRNAGHKKVSSAASSQLILLGTHSTQLALGLLITVLLGRFLEPEDFGFFALISIVFVVGRELNDMGTGSIAAREIVQNPAEEMRLLSALLGWRRLVAFGLALICAGLSLKAENSLQALALVTASLVMATMYNTAFYVVFQIRQAFIPHVVLTMSAQVAMLAACLVTILLNVGGIFVAVIVLLREFVMLFGMKVLALRMLPDTPQPRLNRKRFKGFYSKALIFGIASVCYYLTVHSGTFFTWFHGSNLEVGAYSSAFRLVYPLMTMPWILMIPVLPVFAHLAVSKNDEFAGQVGANFRVLLGVGLVIASSGYLLAPAIMQFLYGDRFVTGAFDAVQTFKWLSIALFFASIVPSLVIGLLATGRESILLGLAGVALVVNVTFNLMLIPILGFTGASMALALAEFTFVIGLLGAVFNVIGVSPLVKHILPFVMPSFGLVIALLLLPEALYFRIIGGTLLTLLALIIVWMLPSAQQMRKELKLIGQSYAVSND